jgi:hypothetical protein
MRFVVGGMIVNIVQRISTHMEWISRVCCEWTLWL